MCLLNRLNINLSRAEMIMIRYEINLNLFLINITFVKYKKQERYMALCFDL
jgi:hypothetical protein